MALVGKWTKIEQVQSETETEIVTINYPTELPKEDPNFNKAGTTEELEIYKIDTIETVYENVYVIAYSINYFKNQIFEGSLRNQMNICWRVYENKEVSLEDPFNFIYEDHLIKKEVDLSESTKTLSEQAYDYLNEHIGFEELIDD
jgi:hypothetical protein